MAHTPEPWTRQQQGPAETRYVIGPEPGNRFICQMDFEATEDDWTLIGAAPTMLAALKECHEFIWQLLEATANDATDMLTNNGEEVEQAAFDALAKAMGVIREGRSLSDLRASPQLG